MKLHKILFSLSCLFSTFLALTPKAAVSAQAAQPEQEKIETTTPFEDLCEDEQFLTDYTNGAYKFDENKQVEFLNFSEYKYEDEYSSSFGLYVYFYNPNNNKLVNLFSNRNTIQLSIDGNHYNKYKLIPVSRSTGEILNLFYKFKVNINKSFHDSLDSESREYSVSSFEFDFSPKGSLEDIEIGNTYIFSGYAAGCNGNEESTLTCEKQGLETIKLNVHGGYKRSGYVNAGLSKAIDLHYVYFEIPNKYINIYGDPYSVSYEFYDRYLDKGIWNIDNGDYYFKPAFGESGDSSYQTRVIAMDPWTATNNPSNESFVGLWNFNGYSGKIDSVAKKNKWSSYNVVSDSPYNPSNPADYPVMLPEYKYREHLKNYSPDTLGERLFRKSNWDTKISDTEIESKINKYGIDYFSTKKNQKYSGVITSTINDLVAPVEANNEAPNLSFWEALFAQIASSGTSPWGRTQEAGETWAEVPAFDIVSSFEDSNGSNYVINKDDVAHFNSVYSRSLTNDSTMCILRFAETEYWSAPIYFSRQTFWGNFYYKKIGYSSFMHIIDDFDIISLGFNINDTITVIPVVSNPIRIIPNADPPVDDRPETTNWWETVLSSELNIKRIIGIVAGVILVFVVLVVISKIIGAISTKRALKANKITIRESKKRRRDKKRYEG